MSASMAIATATGLCLLFQSNFNSIISTMPFLAICKLILHFLFTKTSNIILFHFDPAIGVNDMFIMTNAWQRTGHDKPVAERLSEVMSEAAVAITITSLTDVLSFGIGMWNSLPGVILFCQYTAVALLMDYLYQISFFSAAIAIFGDWEQQKRHCLLYCKTAGCSTEVSGKSLALLRISIIISRYKRFPF